METIQTNPFLSGGFAPVHDEVTRHDLVTEGRLPEALTGRYLRTGPNPLAEITGPHHWFTGDGMIHGIELAGGRAVAYRNRWVRTDAIAAALGEAPVGGPAQPAYDTSNTNVLAFAGRILSLTEGCYPYELSSELDTLRRFDPGHPLPHGLTAHPKIDPVTGELHAFSYWWDAPELIYHRFDPSGQLVATEPIRLPAPVSMHDFAITAEHILFFDQPAVFDLDALATGFPFAWHPENGARIGVLPRSGTAADVRWFETPICYTFHPINAYEATSPTGSRTIALDVPVQPSVYSTGNLGGTSQAPRLQRWVVDLDAGVVRSELVDEAIQDFGRINESLLGTPHRFAYTVVLGEEPNGVGTGEGMIYDGTSILKHDRVAGRREVHDFGPGCHPGEFVFVADPDRAPVEDGGWLLGLVHHDGAEHTDLVVLDAQDVTGDPVATVVIPRRVPYGFHGNWVADPTN